MAGDANDESRFSLRRWSQRKLATQRGARAEEIAHVDVNAPTPPRAVSPAETGERAPKADATLARGEGKAAVVGATPASSASVAAPGAEPPLPPVESLTFESDFSLFMRPDVDETVRRAALRKLLRDPRFNVMDGLDVYIDDYSKPSPIEPEIVRSLMQARYIFSPPKTRVTADGCVEDVPDEISTADASTEPPSSREATEAASPTAPPGEASAASLPDPRGQAAIAPVSADAPVAPEIPATIPSGRE
jgi:hypothetical protein